MLSKMMIEIDMFDMERYSSCLIKEIHKQTLSCCLEVKLVPGLTLESSCGKMIVVSLNDDLPCLGSKSIVRVQWKESVITSISLDLVRITTNHQLVNRFIERNQLPHILLHGPAGTGKTTAALAIANKLFSGERVASKRCDPAFVLELNASDDRGIDTIREQIKTFASTRSFFPSEDLQAKYFPLSFSRFKLVILDEVDAMTLTAQNALRRSNLIPLFYSHGKICQERQIYFDMQLCVLSDTCCTVSVHKISIWSHSSRLYS
jgi:hypothetical protein